MAEVKIYFDDLSETIQEQLWGEIQQQLLDYGEVVNKGRNESSEEFTQRLQDATDLYVNTHNFANRFVI